MKKKNKVVKTNGRETFRLLMEITRTGVPIAILGLQIALYVQ
jgi:hypothetical protein